jgi:hypothetical protein
MLDFFLYEGDIDSQIGTTFIRLSAIPVNIAVRNGHLMA